VNNLAASTYVRRVISFRLQEENQRNREREREREREKEKRKQQSGGLLLFAVDQVVCFIACNRRIISAIPAPRFIPFSWWFQCRRWHPEYADAKRTLDRDFRESENALFTNALGGILLEAELRAPVFPPISLISLFPGFLPLFLFLSLSLFLNAFRKLRSRVEMPRERGSPVCGKCKVHSSRIIGNFSSVTVSSRASASHLYMRFIRFFYSIRLWVSIILSGLIIHICATFTRAICLLILNFMDGN